MTCIRCGEPLGRGRLYCSQVCHYAHRTVMTPARPAIKCLVCERTLPAKDFRKNGKKQRTSPCKECTRSLWNEAYGSGHYTKRGGPCSTPPDPVKRNARHLFQGAVRHGRLKRQPCELCGDVKTHGHHDDYSKPLEVRWLCQKHHGQAHRLPVDPAVAAGVAARLENKQ